MFKNRPALILSALLIAQGSLFYGLSRPEPVALSKSLRGFPLNFGPWRMIRESVLDPEIEDALRADDYLTRDYARPPAEIANLFVAFFKSQRAGQTPHSPKNCLPGSGWVWTVSDTISLTVPARSAPIEVNRYIVSKGEDKALVLYWYQSRDRVVASEYQAAAFVAWDALRYNRTETALVRIVVPVSGGHDDVATRTGIEFIQAIFATLRSFFPL
jgi:EpsI family protein